MVDGVRKARDLLAAILADNEEEAQQIQWAQEYMDDASNQ